MKNKNKSDICETLAIWRHTRHRRVTQIHICSFSPTQYTYISWELHVYSNRCIFPWQNELFKLQHAFILFSWKISIHYISQNAHSAYIRRCSPTLFVATEGALRLFYHQRQYKRFERKIHCCCCCCCCCCFVLFCFFKTGRYHFRVQRHQICCAKQTHSEFELI